MHITKIDVIWSYVGYILRFFSGVLLLPLMLRMLSSEEMGIWYVFLAIGSMTQILDMGFSPTITRNVSYAYAGAEKLVKEGIAEEKNFSKKINYELLAKIKSVSKYVYLYISVLALFLLLFFGTGYIYYITKSFTDNTYYLLAWCIYAIGLFLNFFYSYWIFLLNGVGLIRQGQQAAIISNIFFLAIAVIGLFSNGGIMAVTAAYLFNGVIVRMMCKFFLNKHLYIPDIEMSKDETKDFVKIIWFNAKKMGISSFGAYLILQANTIMTSMFFELRVVAAYGLTLQVINFALSLARIPFSTYLPMLNEMRVTKDDEGFVRLMSMTFVLGGFIFLVCAFGILGLGNDILVLIHSNTPLLPSSMLAFMLFYLFLEYNHSNFATVITTRNEVPFVKASIFSGIAVVLLALFNVKILEMDLWGLLLGQCLAQLAYSNWYWPLVVLREFQISPWYIFRTGMFAISSRFHH